MVRWMYNGERKTIENIREYRNFANLSQMSVNEGFSTISSPKLGAMCDVLEGLHNCLEIAQERHTRNTGEDLPDDCLEIVEDIRDAYVAVFDVLDFRRIMEERQ
jgi:hypothetical protein